MWTSKKAGASVQPSNSTSWPRGKGASSCEVMAVITPSSMVTIGFSISCSGATSRAAVITVCILILSILQRCNTTFAGKIVKLEQHQHNCTQRQRCQTGFSIKENPTSQKLGRVELC